MINTENFLYLHLSGAPDYSPHWYDAVGEKREDNFLSEVLNAENTFVLTM